jgi:hypothetical protein
MKYYFFLLCLTAFQSCQPENECKDIDYGTQYLKAEQISLFPYRASERLIFKDSVGHELLFYLFPEARIISGFSPVQKPITMGDCAGEAYGKWFDQYVSGRFMSDTLHYSLECGYNVNFKWIEDKPIYFDLIYFRIENISNETSNFSIVISHRTDDRGNEDILKYFPDPIIFNEHKEFHQKDFEKVYSRYDDSGGEIHYNYTLGLIAFKAKDQPLWVLDRIE